MKDDCKKDWTADVEALITIEYKDDEAVCARIVSEFHIAVDNLPTWLDWAKRHERARMPLLWDCARDAIKKVLGVGVASVEREEADEAPVEAVAPTPTPTLPANRALERAMEAARLSARTLPADYAKRNVLLYTEWLDKAISSNPELAAHREERLAGAREYFEARKSKTDRTKPKWEGTPLTPVEMAATRHKLHNSLLIAPAFKDRMFNEMNARDIKPEDRQAYLNRLVDDFPDLGGRKQYLAKANELAPYMFAGWDRNDQQMKTFSNMLTEARKKLKA